MRKEIESNSFLKDVKKYEIGVEDLDNGNKLYGNLFIRNTKIKFKGKNNILFIDGEVNLSDSSIEFRGDNNIVYICESDDILTIDLKVYNNSVFYMGKDCWINRGIKIVVSEETNVFFGNDCLISYDTCIRTGDPHLLYDCNTKKRINLSKSVYVGDHVWIGQHVYFLKGVQIGSGAIVGAMTLLSSKKYRSNCCFGGNPVKCIKENVFFLKDNCHKFMEEEREKYQKYDSDEFIYCEDKNVISFDDIERNLVSKENSEKIKFLNEISNNKNKNRFYIK